MRFVSIGDLVTDYYYKENILLGLNGGMTSHNIIANLAKNGMPTAVLGVVGDDIQGVISIKSLDKFGVDTTYVSILKGVRTRCFHVSFFDNTLEFTSKKSCPLCKCRSWYDKSLIDPKLILKQIKKDDILVFDNLNKKNQIIINKSSNKKVIDLGQTFEFDDLSKKEIIKMIKNKFEIINLNERVSKYFKIKLGLENDIDIYNTFKPKLMTITKGAEGAVFIYNGAIYNFPLTSVGDIVDPTGAGDAFMASILKDLAINNFEYDEKKFARWFKNSNKITTKVVSKMGARGHLNRLFKVEKLDTCTCDRLKLKEKTNLCDKNIGNLAKKAIDIANSSLYKKLENIDFNSTAFIGTGCSYAGALFASFIVNQLYGVNTYAIYPRDFLYRNNKSIDKLVLLTYSGVTNDIVACMKNIRKDNIYMITKGDAKKIPNICKDNIISYKMIDSKKERGFLSFEGTLIPITLFFKYYLSLQKEKINLENFIIESFEYWNTKLKELLTKDVISKIQKHGIINIFRGDYTDSACYNLETKLIESGILNVIIHEKKNFSHGRFVNYDKFKNYYSIYFKQKSTNKYEKELLEYLVSPIVLESRYNGIAAAYDLVIASELAIYYIGKVLGVDASSPRYSKKSKKLYFYQGKL